VATTRSATSYSTAGSLSGVAAVSNASAWAVGFTGSGASPRILMLHWNGRGWSRVTSPGLLTGAGGLSAITVVNSKDAWAAGYTGNPGKTTRTLLLHWNGSAWSAVTSPAPVANGSFNAVTATASSGWAVGYYYTPPGSAVDYHALAFRLSGSRWTRVTAGLGGGGVTLTGVATTTGKTSTTWSIGDATGTIYGGVAKWNGKSWNWLSTFPVQGAYHGLWGIAAGPGGIAFAVGSNGNVPETPAPSMEWTGKAWQKVAVSAASGSSLNAVAFAPGGAAWSAGSTGLYTLVMRWNGHAWARVSAPSPGHGNQVDGLGFSASSYGWAVGQEWSSSSAYKTLILHWNGRGWS
jgi:hypothetical protein